MSRRLCALSLFILMLGIVWPVIADAQVIGTFRWQLQSYCNIVALVVTQTGGVYNLDGFDDQCGAATRAPVTGLATLNPNGTIEFGLTIVVTPGAAPVHVAAAIDLATLGGTWRDSTGATGNLVFTPGNGTGGSPRPLPATTAIPGLFTLRADGGFLADGIFGSGAIPDSGAGTRMMWFPRKAAFRAGRVDATAWDDANIGSESVAFNKNTRATGTFSAAFGDSTLASGPSSTAMGSFTTASGDVSTAMGSQTTSSGPGSTAMGAATTASGSASTAMGFNTVASGAQATATGLSSVASSTASFAAGDSAEAGGLTSIAAGLQVIAAGNRTVVLGSYARSLVAGAFMFGDFSTTAPFFAVDPNSFNVRAAGGYRLYSNSALTTGVTLAAGGGAWAALSDVNMKENFRDLNGDDVLEKIARMPIREWNYKTQDVAIRHAGPTAQDFRAAFGLGEDPLRITTIDADGIAFRAIQALEARTREGDTTLAQENAALRAELDSLRTRLERLETLLLERR
jgi:hypothetical protein